MTSSKAELKNSIMQQNIAFIYGRKPEEGLHDLDKRSFIKSIPKMIEKVITDFSGDYHFLSPSFPCNVYLPDESDGDSYPSFEHALQASKINLSTDQSLRNIVRMTVDIREAKKLLKDYPVDVNWKDNCLMIGESLLRDKFFRNKALRSQLMDKTTDFKLEYRNVHGDNFWGTTVVSAGGSNEIKGTNHLGKLLEKIRHEIDEGEDLDKWVAQCFRLTVPKSVRICVDEYVVGDEGSMLKDKEVKEIRQLNPLYVGKHDDSEVVVSHVRYVTF